MVEDPQAPPMAITRAERAGAEAVAAFEYIVNEVLIQDDSTEESLLMHALEQNGITNINKLLSISDTEVENLKANVAGVVTPLVNGARVLPRIFRHYAKYRNDTLGPINGNWKSITVKVFNDFITAGHYHAEVLRENSDKGPKMRPSHFEKGPTVITTFYFSTFAS
jgi:hypothetical protein